LLISIEPEVLVVVCAKAVAQLTERNIDVHYIAENAQKFLCIEWNILSLIISGTGFISDHQSLGWFHVAFQLRME